MDHFFISYSSTDGKEFAIKLADKLTAGPPSFAVWLDKRNIDPSGDWDEQIHEAIKTCKGMIYVMTKDSVDSLSVCKTEWVSALKYKKPLIPLRLTHDAELPFRLASREYINFINSFEPSLARLREYLVSMDTPLGRLNALNYRLADEKRDLSRAPEDDKPRIEDEIKELERQIAQQRAIIANPEAAEKRVQQNIDSGLERVREPEKPVTGTKKSKFINPPPITPPTWFQDRYAESKLIGDFLKDDALRLMTIVGRGGVGKTALVCRLLRSLQGGQLPDDGGTLTVDGIVYLSDARSFHRVKTADFYASLAKLLPEEINRQMATAYKNPQANTKEKIQVLLEAFPGGRVIVLLDNFEEEVDIETGKIKSADLFEALSTFLESPPHGVKIIITTRVAPSDLAMVEPSRQRRRDIDAGLEHPYAENVLRAMDMDGMIGLQNAPEALLSEARSRTLGFPRALEHLFGILSADRNTSLNEILDDTKQLLPEQVVKVLVGEAFSRLDLTAQRVMQALATYRYPIPPTAVDFLLQPFIAGVDSGLVLSRLVNMQFVHRDAGRYYLHQIDRDYALSRISEGKPADRESEELPFTQFALYHRAAEWFKLARKPRTTWKSIEDLNSQLAEFELRCEGEDFNTAADLLLEFDIEYLDNWGHSQLMAELHERLQGKISDSYLKEVSTGNLGEAYSKLGKYDMAKSCYEQALSQARELKNRRNEGINLWSLGECENALGHIELAIRYIEESWLIAKEGEHLDLQSRCLSSLANRYSELGQSERSIEYSEQALALARKTGDRKNEGIRSSNLGDTFRSLDKPSQALQCLNDALIISRETGYRVGEASAHYHMGLLYLTEGKWDDAFGHCKQAIEIADEIAYLQLQNGCRTDLATIYLYKVELGLARTTLEEALKFEYTPNRSHTWTVYGIITLLQGDVVTAQTAFTSALTHADKLLYENPNIYDYLDNKGLSLCGLALCENQQYVLTAQESFKSARQINSDAGNIKLLLRFFDCLSKADTHNILAVVRPYATGEKSD